MPRTTRFNPYWEHRQFWLLVALAVALLIGVSATVRAAGPAAVVSRQAGVADLLDGIERDLAAVRAQLELIGTEGGAAPGGRPLREEIAVTPGLGDGGRGFRLRSMETMVRALDRRIDRLIALQHRAGDDRALDIARLMSLDARSVQWGIEELRFARAPHLARAAQERIRRALDEIARGATAVSTLHAELPARRPARAG